MTKPKKKKFFRKALRYRPQETTVATVDLLGDDGQYLGNIKGIVFSEAARGCGLVVLFRSDLKLHQFVQIQVGALAPIKAKIAWLSEMDEDIMKVGFEYL